MTIYSDGLRVSAAAKNDFNYTVTTGAAGTATIDISGLGLINRPNVQVTMVGGNDADNWRVVSRTNTSVTVKATRRGSVTLLAVQVPLFVSQPIDGAVLDVVVRSND